MQPVSQHSAPALNPAVTQLIEQTLLLGKLPELDALVAKSEELALPDTLRQGLEALRHFRAYYNADTAKLSFEARQQVIRYDADWTMELIRSLHGLHQKKG